LHNSIKLNWIIKSSVVYIEQAETSPINICESE